MSEFKVEFSSSSRATCQICRGKILKGERRLCGNLGSGRYAYYYHVDCIIESYKSEFDKLYFYMYKIKKLKPSYSALLNILTDRMVLKEGLKLYPTAEVKTISFEDFTRAYQRICQEAEEERDNEV